MCPLPEERRTDGVFSKGRRDNLPGLQEKISDGIPLDNSTLYTMQYIESSTIEKLYTFTVSEAVLETLSRILERYCLLYVDKRFKSLEILETLL